MRDQLVVMRERLFQLTAATAARTKKVDGLNPARQNTTLPRPSSLIAMATVDAKRTAEVT